MTRSSSSSWADDLGRPHLDVRVRGSPALGLLPHPVREDAGEQEVEGPRSAARPARTAVQAERDVRRRQRHERGLDARVPASLPQQPRRLVHLGVGVRVGGAAPDGGTR